MQSKINGWNFSRVRCRDHNFNPDSPACCAGVAYPEEIHRNDDGSISYVDYRCEYGHGWFWFAEDGEIVDANGESIDHRIVQDNRDIEERWACYQHTNSRGKETFVIWPAHHEICPWCGEGTQHDCVDCGEQLCASDVVNPVDDGYSHRECAIDRNLVSAEKVMEAC